MRGQNQTVTLSEIKISIVCACGIETFSTKGIQPFTYWFGCLTQFDISVSLCVCVCVFGLIKSGTEGCTRESSGKTIKIFSYRFWQMYIH